VNICMASLWYDETCNDPGELRRKRPTLREIARELSARGHDVSVVQSFHTDDERAIDGVRYRFIRPGAAETFSGRLVNLARRGARRSPSIANRRAIGAVIESGPDLVHFSGMTLHLDLWLLTRAARHRGIPIVVQHHGGAPGETLVGRTIQRWGLASVDRALFTTPHHADQWVERGLLSSGQTTTVMETSSTFEPMPRPEARSQTGMTGCPVFLWVGRLQADKDPVTIVGGFSRVIDCLPDARLYLYYQRDDLLSELRQIVARDARLRRSVEFRGAVDHADLRAIYSSADVFVLGSRHEVAGTAVLEAMACGAIPVVTDIPSFRAMTDNGRYGPLFRPGDVDDFVAHASSIPLSDIPAHSTAVRRQFEAELSFPAIARRLESIYQQVLLCRTHRRRAE
jgi:glycosyltransferase involved in cell wall biosynthesis